jgi:shikimate dehydrogenase
LLIGAGGAARGAIGPLLDSGIDALVVVNRDHAKAVSLVESFGNPRGSMAFEARSYDALRDQSFDVIVNATSASLADASLPLAQSIFSNVPLVYDMMYAATPTRFLVEARDAGAQTIADGLGMLVEQAAESFLLWRAVRPETGPVLEQMRALLATKSSA